ncbi:MAG: helix-turn-helix domain-containing protein [Thermodesulfobacteriota bacterium]
MSPIPYYSMQRQSKDPQYLRLEMARRAKEQGIKPTARLFATTPKTVRKWLRRWQPGTLQGLEDQSRAPKHPRQPIPLHQRQYAIELKVQLRSFGAQRIKRDYDLTISEKAIRKIWHQEGLLKRKRKKPQTKNDLRAVKAAWRLFEQISIDTKDLIDIPELWPQIRSRNLPRVQYTAREVVSGLQFIAYAQERSMANSNLFAQLLIAHLQRYGVNLKGSRFQTDNGSEFIGSWQAKEESAFTKTVQAVPGLTHRTIPPRAHTWQADVETAHALIEDEFYQVESFPDRQPFLDKATTYILWFNVARKNSYKGHKTPWEIIQERDPNLDPQIVTLLPLFLDQLLIQNLNSKPQRGYDVIPYPYNREKTS